MENTNNTLDVAVNILVDSIVNNITDNGDDTFTFDINTLEELQNLFNIVTDEQVQKLFSIIEN